MKRLLAVLGAVAMIGGAVLVRGIITGDDGGGGGGSGGGGGGDGDTHLVCVPELEAAIWKALPGPAPGAADDVEGEDVIRVAIVGKPNAGKSSRSTREFRHDPHSTRCPRTPGSRHHGHTRRPAAGHDSAAPFARLTPQSQQQ